MNTRAEARNNFSQAEAMDEMANNSKAMMKKQSLMLSQIVAFDHQFDRTPTEPLLHQTGRMLYITAGQGKITIQDKTYDLFPDVVVVLMPWQVSQIIEVSVPLKYRLLAFNYTYINYIIKNNFGSISEHENLRDILYSINSILPREQMRPVFRDIFNSFAVLLNSPDDLQRGEITPNITQSLQSVLNNSSDSNYNSLDHWKSVRLTAKLMELMSLYILEVKSTLSNNSIIPADQVPESYNPTRFFQYLYHNLDTYPTLRVAAEKFMMSESTLNRYIRKTTGENYTDLVKDMRINKIIDYLLFSDFSLQEIAVLMGYKDASYISRLTYEKTGFHAQEIREHPHNCNLLNRDKGLNKVRSIYKFMSKNYVSDLKTKDVAENFGVSVSNLNKMLLAAFDKNFSELLNEIRLSKACILLLSTNMEITEIAFQVGYNSIKTFVRNFKNKYDQTPTNFRSAVKLQKTLFTQEIDFKLD